MSVLRLVELFVGVRSCGESGGLERRHRAVSVFSWADITAKSNSMTGVNAWLGQHGGVAESAAPFRFFDDRDYRG